MDFFIWNLDLLFKEESLIVVGDILEDGMGFLIVIWIVFFGGGDVWESCYFKILIVV